MTTRRLGGEVRGSRLGMKRKDTREAGKRGEAVPAEMYPAGSPTIALGGPTSGGAMESPSVPIASCSWAGARHLP